MNLASDGDLKIAAETCYALFKELMKAGFKRDEALELIKTMLPKP